MTTSATSTARTASPAPDVRLPTAEEVAAYERDGFLVVRGLVPAAVLDAAERGMARFYAGDVDAPFPGSTRYDSWDWRPEHGDVLRKNDYTSRMVTDLAALVEWPGIGAFAAALAGTPVIRLFHDQLLYKPGGSDGAADDGTGNVGWHTDRQYWGACTSEEMLTCWVPFHDCTEAVGGVSFVPGSHRWPEQQGLDFFSPDLGAQQAAMAAAGHDVRPVVPDLRRGDATFHHCRTVHGSGPNRTAAPRRSMAIHLQPGDNRHAGKRDADGALPYHRNDELVRVVDGLPDYTDPRISPVLWPVTG
jgi:ectoine hydroxylase-related dioxygenase (phytanoyl-CoA dioxygenase family)